MATPNFILRGVSLKYLVFKQGGSDLGEDRFRPFDLIIKAVKGAQNGEGE